MWGQPPSAVLASLLAIVFWTSLRVFKALPGFTNNEN